MTRTGVGSNQYATKRGAGSDSRRGSLPNPGPAPNRDDADLAHVAWAFDPRREEWEHVGFEAAAAVEWINHGFSVTEAALWAGIDWKSDSRHASRTRWLKANMTPDLAATWRDHGFNEAEMSEWRDLPPDVARSYISALTFSPEQSRVWFHATGLNGNEARLWFVMSYLPGDAARRMRAGYAPDGTVLATDVDSDGIDRASLRRVFTVIADALDRDEVPDGLLSKLAEVTLMLQEHGYNTSAAEDAELEDKAEWTFTDLGEQWRKAGFRSRTSAQRWRDAEFQPGDARSWKEDRFTSDQAAEWRAAGFDVHEAGPLNAREWRDNGFEPAVAAGWADANVFVYTARHLTDNHGATGADVVAALDTAGIDLPGRIELAAEIINPDAADKWWAQHKSPAAAP